ncbi:hypothetical protein SAY87_026642 [Trapa incisa]|uniref:Uncharacterized protein n=1 Tax=Trapa incisa TaxID=236973 RepID=A0AAN7GY78_9MYRT|nr:hypothetical protein SAY87_026642 [Trapa incisa]
MRAPLGVRKGAWTEEEDEILRKCIQKFGEGNWNQVPARAGLNRCRKSCRLRWLNYLKPNIKRGVFQEDEVDLMLRLHKLLGNRWSLIAGRLPGRTTNDVKNYWNSRLKNKNMVSRLPKENHKTLNIVKVDIIKPRPRAFKNFSKMIIAEATTTFTSTSSSIRHYDISSPLMALHQPHLVSMGNDNWWESLLLDDKAINEEATTVEAITTKFTLEEECGAATNKDELCSHVMVTGDDLHDKCWRYQMELDCLEIFNHNGELII